MKTLKSSKISYKIKLIPLKDARKIDPIPVSWKEAAGMLKGKGTSLQKHAKKVRDEWSK